MTDGNCGLFAENLVEVALGRLSGTGRAAVLEHVRHCVRCAIVLEGHAGWADRLLLLGPEVDPPAGFAERVVARLAIADGGGHRARRTRLARRCPRP